jgi:hypothetical protein
VMRTTPENQKNMFKMRIQQKNIVNRTKRM